MLQSSSICKAAIHAGVIGADGGYVDVLPLDKRKHYVGVLKNGVQSERYPSLFCVSFRAAKVTIRSQGQMECEDSRGRVSPFCPRLCQSKRASVGVCIASMCDNFNFLRREAVWQL